MNFRNVRTCCGCRQRCLDFDIFPFIFVLYWKLIRFVFWDSHINRVEIFNIKYFTTFLLFCVLLFFHHEGILFFCPFIPRQVVGWNFYSGMEQREHQHVFKSMPCSFLLSLFRRLFVSFPRTYFTLFFICRYSHLQKLCL